MCGIPVLFFAPSILQSINKKNESWSWDCKTALCVSPWRSAGTCSSKKIPDAHDQLPRAVELHLFSSC